jgi:hypothetical protein
MLARPLAEHDEFGRFRVRRNGYELDVARGRILSMGDDKRAARWPYRKQLEPEF